MTTPRQSPKIGRSGRADPGRIAPLRLFFGIVAGVFVTELVIMVLLPAFGGGDPFLHALIDSVALAVMVSGLAWLLFVRPLMVSLGAWRATETRFAEVFDDSPIGIGVTDLNGRFRAANPALCRMFGYDEAALVGGITWADLTHPDHRRDGLRTLDEIGTGVRAEAHAERRYIRGDGREVWGRCHVSSATDGDGVPMLTVLVEDVTARHDAECELKLAAAVFDTSAEAMMVTDAANRIVKINPAFTEITGYPAADVLGQRPGILESGEHDPAFFDEMISVLHTDGHWRGQVWNRRRNGQVYAQRQVTSVIFGADGRPVNYVTVFSDITEAVIEADRVRREARHDPLTGLANRSLLWDRLTVAFPRSRYVDTALAVLFIDLDGFKPINDQHGHLVGDLVLKAVAERLRSCVRSTDTVARLGGDEFVLLLRDVSSAEIATCVGEKVLTVLTDPIVLTLPATAELTLWVGASIGLALFPDHGSSPEDLLKAADAAMYQAKKAGKGRLCLAVPAPVPAPAGVCLTTCPAG